ncbi:hypothetical protein KO527_20525 [Pseudoalteromonas sp. C2R02]|uniref:hypothetical protein n=1 Tax=Pseudoalteromonas sp. C2R02 TaxID=2841565 RepID=UPI001C08444A|nr:hypothetical protein [Pseudoalteromonas sp. C2R02]MBU2971740.1 hypothetical protein [Pseudoalteromonas sp. C2R02]
MKTLLVVNSLLKYCPRASRQLDILKTKHEVCVLSTDLNLNGATSHYQLQSSLGKHKFIKFFLLFLKQYSKYLNLAFTLPDELKGEKFDKVICYDLILLPILISQIDTKQWSVDLREYYPKQFENSIVWKLTFGRLFNYLCKSQLQSIDELTTVSEGLSTLYTNGYGVKPKVRYSLPIYHDLNPSTPNINHIKLVHHGVSNPNRKLELMIEATKLLPKYYSLTLYIVNNNEKYYGFLKSIIKDHDNIILKAPLTFEEIIPTLNKYDIGLFCPEKTTENLNYAMPNKLFEFIQARIAIVVTPLKECSNFVLSQNCGKCSSSFVASDISHTIKSINHNDLKKYKSYSDRIAKVYSLKHNKEK